MTGPSSTVHRGRGCGRFSRPDGGDAREDRGSGGSNGNGGTPNDSGSGEERNDGSTLPATTVNPLDSAKRPYRRWREGRVGGTMRQRWMTMATTAASSRNSAGRGGGVADAARRSEHSAARRRLPISSHGERIARAVCKNRVVILAGLTGSGKLTQVLQFLLEEEEEEEEEGDPVNGGSGGGDDPCHPPDGILEQRQ